MRERGQVHGKQASAQPVDISSLRLSFLMKGRDHEFVPKKKTNSEDESMVKTGERRRKTDVRAWATKFIRLR